MLSHYSIYHIKSSIVVLHKFNIVIPAFVVPLPLSSYHTQTNTNHTWRVGENHTLNRVDRSEISLIGNMRKLKVTRFNICMGYTCMLYGMFMYDLHKVHNYKLNSSYSK